MCIALGFVKNVSWAKAKPNRRSSINITTYFSDIADIIFYHRLSIMECVCRNYLSGNCDNEHSFVIIIYIRENDIY